MENCPTWIIISMWQNDLHTNTSRSVWPILYGLMIKMLQYKMYPAGELAVLRQLLFNSANLICRSTDILKYFRESLGIQDNESQLYINFFPNDNLLKKKKGKKKKERKKQTKCHLKFGTERVNGIENWPCDFCVLCPYGDCLQVIMVQAPRPDLFVKVVLPEEIVKTDLTILSSCKWVGGSRLEWYP